MIQQQKWKGIELFIKFQLIHESWMLWFKFRLDIIVFMYNKSYKTEFNWKLYWQTWIRRKSYLKPGILLVPFTFFGKFERLTKMEFDRTESIVLYTCTVLFLLIILLVFYRLCSVTLRKLCSQITFTSKFPFVIRRWDSGFFKTYT